MTEVSFLRGSGVRIWNTSDPAKGRNQAIIEHDLLNHAPEPDLQALVELGKRLLGVDCCAITMIGAERQFMKACAGLELDPRAVDSAICATTVETDEIYTILDAQADPKVSNNPLVTGPPNIRFYSGAAIKSATGVRMGAFCAFSTSPREIVDDAFTFALRQLTEFASNLIQMRPGTRHVGAVRAFADATALGIVTTNAFGKITSWNAASERIFGHEKSAMLGKDLSVIIPNRFRAAHYEGIHRAATNRKHSLDGKPVEVTAVHSSGREFPIEISLASWETEEGLSFGAHIQDITKRRARDEELSELARADPLTGLMNMKSFRNAVDEVIRDGEPAVLLTVDLDGFKLVNDSLGHAFGDALLQTLAIRILKIAGDDCPVARLGGDEFAIMLRGYYDLFSSKAFASSLLSELREPILMDGYRLQVGASIGMAATTDHAIDVDELFVRADLAMFRAKKEGGRKVRFFDRTMSNELVARRAFRDDLRQASGDEQWELYYQPQFDLNSGVLTGVEALLRWRHPQWGIIYPSTFMEVLESHVISYEVGNWVLDEACRQLADWRSSGLRVPRVSVNLFSAQIYSGSLAMRVRDALQAHNLEYRDLELEITETIALRHDDEALAPLGQLISEGVGVAFDDFGTGFASLSTLQRIPLTRLKIDRSFVKDLCTDAQSVAITGGIIAIGKSLGVEIIAEGIENEDQRVRLIELGCDQGQGYLFDKGLPANDLREKYQLADPTKKRAM